MTFLRSMALPGLVLLAAGLARAEEAPLAARLDPPGAAPLDPGETLLRNLADRLPRVEMTLDAVLRSETRTGRQDRAARLDARLDYRGGRPQATYRLRDTFGAAGPGLRVATDEDGVIRFFLLDGERPETPATWADLTTPINGLDLTWIDLSLSFLWWPGAVATGKDMASGRECNLVDVPYPGHPEGGGPMLRLWIDPETGLFVRAESRTAGGVATRQLQVKTFRRIQEETWAIQDIDVVTLPSRHRTRLFVESFKLTEEPAHAP